MLIGWAAGALGSLGYGVGVGGVVRMLGSPR